VLRRREYVDPFSPDDRKQDIGWGSVPLFLAIGLGVTGIGIYFQRSPTPSSDSVAEYFLLAAGASFATALAAYRSEPGKFKRALKIIAIFLAVVGLQVALRVIAGSRIQN
jgi:hypothetical protein